MSNAVVGLPNPVADFRERAESYHRFMLGVKWVALILGSALTFLVMGFCSSAGLAAGALAGLVVLLVGIYALRHGLAHSTEAEMGYPPHR